MNERLIYLKKKQRAPIYKKKTAIFGSKESKIAVFKINYLIGVPSALPTTASI